MTGNSQKVWRNSNFLKNNITTVCRNRKWNAWNMSLKFYCQGLVEQKTSLSPVWEEMERFRCWQSLMRGMRVHTHVEGRVDLNRSPTCFWDRSVNEARTHQFSWIGCPPNLSDPQPRGCDCLLLFLSLSVSAQNWTQGHMLLQQAPYWLTWPQWVNTQQQVCGLSLRGGTGQDKEWTWKEKQFGFSWEMVSLFSK